MRTLKYKNLNESEKSSLLKRPAINLDDTLMIVKPIIMDIKENGLSAAKKYARLFDHFEDDLITVTPDEFDMADVMLSLEVKRALEIAAENIRSFHRKQFPVSYEIETMEGIKCSREFRAIENVGLYIPGGTAVLPSTMLMLGIPAQIAGCQRIAAFSPTNKKISNEVLYAAKLCGITEFYKIGGAQAIALMAYGDENIKPFDKIFGPGNQYVTAAKLLVSTDSTGCSIDMPAGPSEVLIIADECSNPEFIAADLLSQAEHGNDSQVVLISTSENLIITVSKLVDLLLDDLPRKEFARNAIGNSFALITETLEEAFKFSNRYAPEHLIIHLDNAAEYKKIITNAGSVFLGRYSPESVGDYASGTNHSLPTYGYARSFSGVTVESFMKSVSFQELTLEGLQRIGETVETLAEAEALMGHKNAVKVRLKND